MTTTTQHKKPLPDFKNRKEMAKWFDNHDMTDYDFKPINIKFDLDKPKEETVMFRLDKGRKTEPYSVSKKQRIEYLKFASNVDNGKI